MWSTKVEKKLFCGATVRLILENVLPSSNGKEKKASTGYTTHQEKIQKVQGKRNAGKYSEKKLHTWGRILFK